MFRSIILRLGKFSEKILDKTKTHILFSLTLSPEKRAVNEIMWKSMVQPDEPQMTI